MSKTYFVYIMASARNGTLYICMTRDIGRRVWEHREGLVPGFTKTYGVKRLVYFESHADVGTAIWRETRLKKWKRRWKIELIEKANPTGKICTKPSLAEQRHWMARCCGP